MQWQGSRAIHKSTPTPIEHEMWPMWLLTYLIFNPKLLQDLGEHSGKVHPGVGLSDLNKVKEQ